MLPTHTELERPAIQILIYYARDRFYFKLSTGKSKQETARDFTDRLATQKIAKITNFEIKKKINKNRRFGIRMHSAPWISINLGHAV